MNPLSENAHPMIIDANMDLDKYNPSKLTLCELNVEISTITIHNMKHPMNAPNASCLTMSINFI